MIYIFGQLLLLKRKINMKIFDKINDYVIGCIDGLFYLFEKLDDVISMRMNEICQKFSKGDSVTYEDNINDRDVYTKYQSGYWTRSIYDENKNLTEFSDADGFWIKIKYNELNKKQEFYEDSTGFWSKIYYTNDEDLYVDSKNQRFILKKD